MRTLAWEFSNVSHLLCKMCFKLMIYSTKGFWKVMLIKLLTDIHQLHVIIWITYHWLHLVHLLHTRKVIIVSPIQLSLIDVYFIANGNQEGCFPMHSYHLLAWNSFFMHIFQYLHNIGNNNKAKFSFDLKKKNFVTIYNVNKSPSMLELFQSNQCTI